MKERIKVRVKDLKSNPFRNIEDGLVDRESVEALKQSINETDFWLGLIVREDGRGKYEIAFGHHRLIALQELGIEEIEVEVKELTDIMMVKHMVNENYTSIQRNTGSMVQAVESAKQVLDAELKKYETWEELKRANRFISSLIDEEKGFRSAKGQGVGQTTLLKFLGKPPWYQWMVQRSLSILKEDKEGSVYENKQGEKFTFCVDRRAVELFNIPRHADVFRGVVKEIVRLSDEDDKEIIEAVIPFEEQKETAKEVIRNIQKRELDLTRETVGDEIRKIVKRRKGKRIEEWAEEHREDPRLKKLEVSLEEIEKKVNPIISKMDEFMTDLNVFVKKDKKGKEREADEEGKEQLKIELEGITSMLTGAKIVELIETSLKVIKLIPYGKLKLFLKTYEKWYAEINKRERRRIE